MWYNKEILTDNLRYNHIEHPLIDKDWCTILKENERQKHSAEITEEEQDTVSKML